MMRVLSFSGVLGAHIVHYRIYRDSIVRFGASRLSHGIGEIHYTCIARQKASWSRNAYL
jgi:hypothetical protein